VVSRAAKLLAGTAFRDRSRTSCRPQDGLARCRLASHRCPACGVAQKRCENKTQSRNVLRSRRPRRTSPPTPVRRHWRHPEEVVRHRLSMAGNRKLNYALHMVATCQARSDDRGEPTTARS
jgi:hypothetical protein